MLIRGKNVLITLLALLFPVVAFSAESMSFNPTPSDISVVFLGNIFGVVDGILHGSGGQMMGAIFNVFNSAILALGGVVMMYIIMVSTMNTAHEGQMLGQKWSSIWVPVRATMGLALLIPKSSGYCLMQIFVMWVVVQGVGIADKVWGTALDYLNHGGVIIQAQMDPVVSRKADNNSVIIGASTILYGQTCMLAIQRQLEAQREIYMELKKDDLAPCGGVTPDTPMANFCDRSVPDFLSTVDPMRAYDDSPSDAAVYSVPMPNFDSGPYMTLNGICGKIQWLPMNMGGLGPQEEEEEEEETSAENTVEAIASQVERQIQHQVGQFESKHNHAAHEVKPGSPLYKQYAAVTCTPEVCTPEVCASQTCTRRVCTLRVCWPECNWRGCKTKCSGGVCTGGVCTPGACTPESCVPGVCTDDLADLLNAANDWADAKRQEADNQANRIKDEAQDEYNRLVLLGEQQANQLIAEGLIAADAILVGAENLSGVDREEALAAASAIMDAAISAGEAIEAASQLEASDIQKWAEEETARLVEWTAAETARVMSGARAQVAGIRTLAEDAYAAAEDNWADAEALGQAAAAAAETFGAQMASDMESMGAAIGDGFNSILGDLGDLVNKLTSGFVNTVEGLAGLGDSVNAGIASVEESVNQGISNLEGIVNAQISGLADGIQELADFGNTIMSLFAPYEAPEKKLEEVAAQVDPAVGAIQFDDTQLNSIFVESGTDTEADRQAGADRQAESDRVAAAAAALLQAEADLAEAQRLLAEEQGGGTGTGTDTETEAERFVRETQERLDAANEAKVQAEFGTGTVWELSPSDIATIQKSRAAAIEQMYISLASTARAIVSNDPQINGNNNNSSEPASDVADYQFGIPLSSSRMVCQGLSEDCPYWGKIQGESSPILLDGTELQDAVTDYNAVMLPALKLLNDIKDKDKKAGARRFIEGAKRSGWILAGSYFFDLVQLNGKAKSSTTTDFSSGLGQSSFNLEGLIDVAEGAGTCANSGEFPDLCEFFNGNNTRGALPPHNIIDLFKGTSGNASKPTLSSDVFTPMLDDDASTVYGYANNAMLIDLPGQSGLKLNHLNQVTKALRAQLITTVLPDVRAKPDPSCSGAKWLCVISREMERFWWSVEKAFRVSLNKALQVAAQAIWNGLIIGSIDTFVGAFEHGVGILATQGANPIVQGAIMGIHYINVTMSVWVEMLMLAVAFWWFPLFYAVLMIALPLYMSWMAIMLGIGFVTAYYTPFLPYMIFTFGAIGWLIAVIEAMAAAPLMALGIAHPEGHDALGKSEQGLMILLNVFLRPAMMVIGFIAAIALCYVGIWLLNSGFGNILDALKSKGIWNDNSYVIPWGSLFGYFFSILVYTMIYLTIVEKSFSLIALLPDKILRWIGGAQESTGQEAMQMTSDVKGKVEKAGDDMGKQAANLQKQMASKVGEAVSAAQEAMSGAPASGDLSIEENNESTDSASDDADSGSDAGSDGADSSGSDGSGKKKGAGSGSSGGAAGGAGGG